MAKIALFPFPHIKKRPKGQELATKDDIAKLVARLEFVAKIRLLSARSRRQLVKQLRKEGKL